MKSPIALVAIALCAVLAAADGATAGTASVVDGNLLYEASPGETNRVFVVDGAQGLRVIDTTAPVSADAGCSAVAVHEALCPAIVDVRFRNDIHIAAGDMDDFVKVATNLYSLARIEGGEGADDLEGGFGSNELDGGPGADVFRPSRYGFDVVDYSSRAAPVTVTLGDSLANDGEAGEGDLVSDGIREVRGGQAGDTISVSACAADIDERLFGQGGDDALASPCVFSRLDGGTGADTLRARASEAAMSGGPGDDALIGGGGSWQVLDGEQGDDRLDGRGGGFDFIYGGPGSDRLTGGRGFGDEMRGGAGPDTIYARDGRRDRVFGNDGRDRARVDRARDRIRTVEELF